MGVGLRFAIALVGAAAVSPSAALDQVLLPYNKELALIWQPASVDGPRPVVIGLHGCGGLHGRGGEIGARYVEYAERWNAAGWHVLLPDSFSARGVRSICRETGKRSVTVEMRRRDVNAALAWLQARPDVDSARIALVGWSNGGSTVLRTIDRPDWTVAPVSAIAFYPSCTGPLKNGRYASAVPLLLLVGALDDWTRPADCETLVHRLSAKGSGPPAQLISYPDSYHGFDGTGHVRRRSDIPAGPGGEGVHVGGNPAARTDALQRSDQFLKNTLDAR